MAVSGLGGGLLNPISNWFIDETLNWLIDPTLNSNWFTDETLSSSLQELFGDIGPLVNIQMINSTTALITYYAAQHSIRAVKVYNCRLLDGIPMNCTILPTTATVGFV